MENVMNFHSHPSELLSPFYFRFTNPFPFQRYIIKYEYQCHKSVEGVHSASLQVWECCFDVWNPVCCLTCCMSEIPKTMWVRRGSHTSSNPPCIYFTYRSKTDVCLTELLLHQTEFIIWAKLLLLLLKHRCIGRWICGLKGLVLRLWWEELCETRHKVHDTRDGETKGHLQRESGCF